MKNLIYLLLFTTHISFAQSNSSIDKQLDASFSTLDNIRRDVTYTFIFNGKGIFFYSVFTKTASSFAKEVMETDFYKSL